jgi:hypothetical protein
MYGAKKITIFLVALLVVWPIGKEFRSYNQKWLLVQPIETLAQQSASVCSNTEFQEENINI